jgi:hypothetical protein
MAQRTSLTYSEWEKLYKLPAYISLLAANHDGGIDKAERKAAIKLSHIKTYSCNPLLVSFYDEADKVFEQNIAELDKTLPKERVAREHAIKEEVAKLHPIIEKLGPEYASALQQSMKTFTRYVSKAHNSVFEYFLFPMPIKGITE